MKPHTVRRTLPTGNWQILTTFKDPKGRHISTISRPKSMDLAMDIFNGILAMGFNDQSFNDWKFETVIFGVKGDDGNDVRVTHETAEEAAAYHEAAVLVLSDTIANEVH